MKVEVKQKEDKTIYWSKPQLVTRKVTRIIVLTNGLQDGGMFGGTVIKGDDHRNQSIGYHSSAWKKDDFELFEGEIVITQ